ncbi:hypothetical protein G6N05_02060 [Flavobacterium sp. F372]|uniref:TonB C-terminal domain-containing protein n=1 Tax=Flavobacterium bernardetii TaxID=2813823 RepID=A0ABR7IV44_9FLAO|nr:hypothetical protein [Flavobacterium bernardetii]MBC5833660.1 hypothetical protein [Flavobacterium bernardetii]NHF68893.1 hypothetical protein [Flavobacterium bernardetii]
MKNFIFLLMLTTFGFSQTNESLIDKLKNEDLKTIFQSYLNQEKITIEFFNSNAKANNAENIVVTNQENIAYYEEAISKFQLLEKHKEYIYTSIRDKKYDKDRKLIYDRFVETKSRIDAYYSSRLAILKTNYTNLTDTTDNNILPSKICMQLVPDNDFISPTHETCKNLEVTTGADKSCFANYLRSKIVKLVQLYLPGVEDTLSISSLFQFVINKEGKLVFDKFLKSSGSFELDLAIYKGFRRLAISTVFTPAKHKDKIVSVYYQLPIKMVFNQE